MGQLPKCLPYIAIGHNLSRLIEHKSTHHSALPLWTPRCASIPKPACLFRTTFARQGVFRKSQRFHTLPATHPRPLFQNHSISHVILQS